MENAPILGDIGTRDEMEGRYLTFWTDRQLFGVPISAVVQIVGIQPVTVVPDYPYYAKGIMNLRGSVTPVIDIRLRLGKPEAEYSDRTCIIVVNIWDRFFGFIVDEVEEVTGIDADQISPPPALADCGVSYLTGVARVENRLVLILDTGKLLGAEEWSLLSGSTNEAEG